MTGHISYRPQRCRAWLVARGLDVYGARPRPPTLEDVYFEIQERASA